MRPDFSEQLHLFILTHNYRPLFNMPEIKQEFYAGNQLGRTQAEDLAPYSARSGVRLTNIVKISDAYLTPLPRFPPSIFHCIMAPRS